MALKLKADFGGDFPVQVVSNIRQKIRAANQKAAPFAKWGESASRTNSRPRK